MAWNLEEEIAAFGDQLGQFAKEHDLPPEWFAFPDHLAIKAYDLSAYRALVREIKPHALQISEQQLDGRRLAAAQLATSVSVGNYGPVEWFELMEPRPAKVGHDVVGIEHMEFYVQDFNVITGGLHQRGVPYERESNPNHAWITVLINEAGQEIKFTNGRLANIAQAGIEEHRAVIL